MKGNKLVLKDLPANSKWCDKDHVMLLVRIPAKKTTHSGPTRPPIPAHEDHFVPSSALVILLSVFADGFVKVLVLFSHRFPCELDLVGIVDKAVEDGVGHGRVAQVLIQVLHGQLAGDAGGAVAVAVLQ